MLIKGVTGDQVQAAIDKANADWLAGNLELNRFDPANGKGNRWNVTIRVKSSKGPGARLSAPNYGGRQRHMVAACWHAHAAFFDGLPRGAQIVSSLRTLDGGRRVTYAGNHATYAGEDQNVGSMANPAAYGDLCECTDDVTERYF